MIPRTSRTGTLRAASAACAVTPSLIGLPLLVSAFLAVLWLFCAAPAQADTSSSTALGAPLSEASAATGEALRLGETQTLRKQPLEKVVPEEVTEPVTATLGTVHQSLEQGHQRLEKSTAETAAAAAALPEPAVAEVRGEVRGFVAEIDRTREEAVERGLVRTLPVTGPRAPRSQDTESTEATETDRRSEEDERSSAPEPLTAQGTPARHAVSAQHHHHPAPAVQAAEAAASEEDGGDHTPEHRRAQPTTGSPAPTANGPAPAPSVAGYLTVAPLPAPATDAVRLAAHRLHTVPADPADDLTVSPD